MVESVIEDGAGRSTPSLEQRDVLPDASGFQAAAGTSIYSLAHLRRETKGPFPEGAPVEKSQGQTPCWGLPFFIFSSPFPPPPGEELCKAASPSPLENKRGSVSHG